MKTKQEYSPSAQALKKVSKQVAGKVSNVLKAAQKAAGSLDVNSDEEVVIPTGMKPAKSSFPVSGEKPTAPTTILETLESP